MADILVTRHADVVELLKELKIINEETIIISHATIEDIRGKEVIGNIPVDMAAYCSKIHSIVWDIPFEARGREWTKEETKAYYRGIKTYEVIEVYDLETMFT